MMRSLALDAHMTRFISTNSASAPQTKVNIEDIFVPPIIRCKLLEFYIYTSCLCDSPPENE